MLFFCHWSKFCIKMTFPTDKDFRDRNPQKSPDYLGSPRSFCQKWEYLPVSHQSHLKEPRIINCERLALECAHNNMDQSPRRK